MTDEERRHEARIAERDRGLDRAVEAERLLRWAQRAAEVCGAWRLNQLAERCAMYMNQDADREGTDLTFPYLREFLEEQQVELKASLEGERAKERLKVVGKGGKR
jgi:hypothetical protein